MRHTQYFPLYIQFFFNNEQNYTVLLKNYIKDVIMLTKLTELFFVFVLVRFRKCYDTPMVSNNPLSVLTILTHY